MREREDIVALWFSMWLRREDLGIDGIFAEDALYIESWGPEYRGREAVKHWFREWNSRGRVLAWDIRQYFHSGDQTAVEWYFKNQMNGGRLEEFDGMSLIRWTADNRIALLKEFGCNIRRYDPYRHGGPPRFQDSGAKWF